MFNKCNYKNVFITFNLLLGEKSDVRSNFSSLIFKQKKNKKKSIRNVRK